ncbi:MAG: galactose ABC transporter substrate-binding protein [Lachnospiraceae bacterium]|nr:galactose ABC transporter substrate-binding protein [Lachnospiraceae bacterium]
MKLGKRLIVCVISLGLIVGSLSGCGNDVQEEEVKSIKIGVTVYDQYDTFVSQLIDRFNVYASEKEAETGVAINIEVYNAADSQPTQNSQVETMMGDGCNVVCVNLVDRTEPKTIIDMAEKNNVPVIFFNRELVAEDLERWEQLYYVGAKAFESGIMEGEIAADVFKNDSAADKNGDGIFQYIVLEGEAGHQDAIVRTEYSVSTIIERGVEVEKLNYAIANWNRAQAQTKMTQMLGEYGNKIELVLANNDDMALGAIDALKAAEIAPERWPVVVGIDGTNVGLEAVKNGEMAGTVYNDKEGQAKAMLDLAYELSTGGSLAGLDMEDGKYIRLPYAKVGVEDVEEYIEKSEMMP